MSQFVYQGPMGQGGESRALAQDQYEEDQRMLNKSQHRDKYGQQPSGTYNDVSANESDNFAPIATSPRDGGHPSNRRGTVLRVSSAQKKRPPAQGVQGYEEDEEDETLRPTLKYENLYNPNDIGVAGDPFSPDQQYAGGVSPYRKSKSKRAQDPRSEKSQSTPYTQHNKQVPSKITNYGPIPVDYVPDEDQYGRPAGVHASPNPYPQEGPSNSSSIFAQPMPANRQQQHSKVHQPAPLRSGYDQRRLTEQKPGRANTQSDYPGDDGSGLMSPQQNDELLRRHEKAIQDEIQQLQNESRSYRKQSPPRNARKASPLRTNKYMEDSQPISGHQPLHRPMTDVKSIKVTKGRNSNLRQRPGGEADYNPQVNSYSKPVRVAPGQADMMQGVYPSPAIHESPRLKNTYPSGQQQPEPTPNDDDDMSIQDQILRNCHKIKEVQEEHMRILQKTQELYNKKKEVDDLERQFNAMNKNLINKEASPSQQQFKSFVPLHEPIIQASQNQSINTQQMSFLNYSGRPERNQPSGERQPYYVKSGKQQRNRDDSRNTFQMLNELSDYERSGSRGRFSRMSQGARDDFADNEFPNPQNPKSNNQSKLKDLYREFCDAVNSNKQRGQRNMNEICLHNILMDLHLIGPETEDNFERQATRGVDQTAISTENVRVQRQKFFLPLRNEVEHFDEHTKEDVLKNLFKILCGIMNTGLKQRGINMMDTMLLRQYLDSINFNLQDNDLILLNQLSAMKGLANRKAFSLSAQHLDMIHVKFKNLFQQRSYTLQYQDPAYKQQQRSPQYDQSDVFGGRKGSTVIMPQKSDIDRNTPPVHVKMGRRGQDNILPRELQYHELEESREFRESRQEGYKPHRVKSKPYGSAVQDRRQPNMEDTIERYRPMEYRRPDKKEESDTEEEQPPYYKQYQKQQPSRPYDRYPEQPPYQVKSMPPQYEEDPRHFRPMRKSQRPQEEDRRRNGSNPRGSRSNSLIGRGSHLAPESSPARRRNPSPGKLDSIQDFLNAKPAATNNRKQNPNRSGIGRQYRDISGSGVKDNRYEPYSGGSSPGRGGFRSPNSKYSDGSGYNARGMHHGGYNL